MKLLSNNIVSIIFVLIPLSIASGPFLADLSVVLIALYFIINSIYEKNL
mgnify:CR=1 FL=1